MEMVIFRVNGQPYGMKIDFLEGIEDLKQVTPVANAPSNVIGISNIRGEIVPIFDLAKKFGKISTETSHKYLMVRLGGEPLCLKVDAVDGMNQFEELDVRKVPSIIVGEDTEYISNIVRIGEGELALVIQPDKLITSVEKKDIAKFVSGI